MNTPNHNPNDPPQPHTTPLPLPSQTRWIDSNDLFQGAREVLILHDSEYYRLRITKHGKLLLIK